MRSNIGVWTLSSGRWWVTLRSSGKRNMNTLTSCFYSRLTPVLLFSRQTDLVKSTYCTLYGFKTNLDYEVRVRCKMLGGKAFGEFSDSVFVHIPSKDKGPRLSLLFSYSGLHTCSDINDYLFSVSVSNHGLAHIWSSVCCGHPDVGGHFTAEKVCLFNYSPLWVGNLINKNNEKLQ